MKYDDFLERKKVYDAPTGLKTIPKLHDKLFGFQCDIVAWALRRGRAAIFADCGMGKTLMQLEWARHVPGDVLILFCHGVNMQFSSHQAFVGHESLAANRRFIGIELKESYWKCAVENMKHAESERKSGLLL